MTPLINGGPVSEHIGYPNGLPLEEYESAYNLANWQTINFKGNAEKCCLLLKENWGGKKTFQTSYFIGADWVENRKLAVYVEPKLNETAKNTDYFKMLFEGFSNPDIANYLPDLFEIKVNEPAITIPSKLDVLTPLLVIQYLNILKGIVKKGLKKSHRSVEANLSNRIKGKLLVGQQIKQNVFKNQLLKNYCRFNSFSVDGPENRVLKKGLQFAIRYINSGALKAYRPHFEKLLNYIQPAFVDVGAITTAEDLRHFKVSAFFKDYQQALHIARMIFKRYGFNINSVNTAADVVTVPPFWIDMSKLYELYVLAQLKKQEYGRQIRFQFHGAYGAPDFLLLKEKYLMVIDAKYKPYYDERYVPDDVRQVSGYARDEGILTALNACEEPLKSTVVDCLIVYPLRGASLNNSLVLSDLKADKIKEFHRFYKKALELPFQETPM